MNDEIRQELKNRYRVELGQRLGAGGFGEVFRAQTEEGVPCAIKVSLERLDASSEWVAKELRGLDAVKTITDHPRICALFDIWQIRGHLVTRWQLGQASLAERLAECCRQGLPAIPLDELLGHMAAAAQGIDFLNRECGIYHRDIKPENLLLFHGHVKLADLGLAKFVGESTRSHTGSGTLGYIPPEGWEEHRLTASSDVYSLAATYLRLRTGRNPFGDNARDIILRQEAGQPAVDGLDEAEATLLRRALARDPKSRPQDGAVAWVGELSDAVGVGGGAYAGVVINETPRQAAAALVRAHMDEAGPAAVPGLEWQVHNTPRERIEKYEDLYNRALSWSEGAVIDAWHRTVLARDDVFTFPDIPDNTLSNALRYAGVQRNELLIGVLDDGEFRTGDNAIVFTTNRLIRVTRHGQAKAYHLEEIDGENVRVERRWPLYRRLVLGPSHEIDLRQVNTCDAIDAIPTFLAEAARAMRLVGGRAMSEADECDPADGSEEELAAEIVALAKEKRGKNLSEPMPALYGCLLGALVAASIVGLLAICLFSLLRATGS